MKLKAYTKERSITPFFQGKEVLQSIQILFNIQIRSKANSNTPKRQLLSSLEMPTHTLKLTIVHVSTVWHIFYCDNVEKVQLN